jgi:hypothetical protein
MIILPEQPVRNDQEQCYMQTSACDGCRLCRPCDGQAMGSSAGGGDARGLTCNSDLNTPRARARAHTHTHTSTPLFLFSAWLFVVSFFTSVCLFLCFLYSLSLFGCLFISFLLCFFHTRVSLPSFIFPLFPSRLELCALLYWTLIYSQKNT